VFAFRSGSYARRHLLLLLLNILMCINHRDEMDETCSTHGEMIMHRYLKAIHLWVLVHKL